MVPLFTLEELKCFQTLDQTITAPLPITHTTILKWLFSFLAIEAKQKENKKSEKKATKNQFILENINFFPLWAPSWSPEKVSMMTLFFYPQISLLLFTLHFCVWKGVERKSRCVVKEIFYLLLLHRLTFANYFAAFHHSGVVIMRWKTES